MAETVKAFDGMQALPLMKQIFILVGLSASIALGFYVAMWAKGEEFLPLGGSYTPKESGAVVEVLDRSGITYRINENSGLVMIKKDQVHRAKMSLAKEGISNDGHTGLELLDEDMGLTTSQFIERTRYVRGLQGELARSIAQIQQVKSARVHLAIPKQSSFVRHKKPPSASVFLDVHGGVKLSPQQVGGIANFVASSIQGMTTDQVTVVDQYGTLLSGKSNDEMNLAVSQLDYKRSMEEIYANRITELLEPMLGQGRVQAKVTAQIDFSSEEKTFENYNPSSKAVRSEQTLNVSSSGAGFVGGIPGALSNVPPEESTVTEVDEEGNPINREVSGNSRQQSTRNFELDRTIGHEKRIPGQLERLSVAVVVDDIVTYSSSGKESKTPHTPEELTRLEGLVKNAIGFDEERGDRVSVINASFAATPPVAELPPVPFHQQPWFYSVVKQSLAALFVLIIFFTVIRPLIKNLSNVSAFQKAQKQKMLEQTQLAQALEMQSQPGQDDLSRMRAIISEDPKRVAQVVKTMVKTENE